MHGWQAGSSGSGAGASAARRSSADTEAYEGWGFTLDRPFEAICADASFRNRFINTIGFYTSINTRLLRFKAEAEQFQDALHRELERD